ncbi:MAG: hypothetical protein EOO22_05845 [Comamonadaceae bacterium]|nr:MAG: hypothetical protein EOO22_05845 [Comamonadaceae bacterium]
MKKHITLLAVAAVAAVTGSAMAESQYGYTTTTGAAVTAQARVTLSVVVPKLILLRVGGQGNTAELLNWTAPITWPTAPAGAPTAGVNLEANWTGGIPTVGTVTNPAAIPVFAWTNNTGGGSLSYVASVFAPTGGPSLSNITVTSAAGLAHPIPATLAAASTTPTAFAAGTVAGGSWTYSLTGSALTWTPGTYTSTVTYTATSV